MRVGITFGGYCPLHQGHMDLIMKAKRENDRCVVFVCGYDGEERGEKNDLPLVKRYRIIKNFLTDGVTDVEYISDTEIGLDESMSDSNWNIWLRAAYQKISRFGYTCEDEFVWYVGEESYKNQIEKEENKFNLKVSCEVIDRNENLVSGTLCRQQPLKYWYQITAPFRAYYSHNILISGTASEGKTTLTEDIGRYFGLPYSYEKGRDNCHLKTDPEFTVKDFIYNLYEQHKYNEELICSPQNPGIFVSDTDNCVTLMYADVYKDRTDFSIGQEEYDLLYKMADAYTKTTKWDKIFLLKPHNKPIVNDGERYMPDSDYRIRLGFYEKLKGLYDGFGYTYEELDGNYYDNFLAVKNYITNLYKE